MTDLTRVATVETGLVAAVLQGTYGLWFIRKTGHGYQDEEVATPERLLELRRDGYALTGDVALYVALYGPKALQEPAVSQSALDADSAGYGAGVSLIGALAGDDGRDEGEW